MDEASCSGSKKYLLPKAHIHYLSSFDIDFPSDGVINSAGYLFHHFLPYKITEPHMKRLQDFGIQYKYKEAFTPEEDERIRKNWRRFACKHGFLYEDARVFAGFMDHYGDWKLMKRQNNQLIKLGMWPRLCRRLENRSAMQVQRRIMAIFDPHYVGKPDLLSYEEIVDAYGRMGCGEDVLDISMEMRVPFFRLVSAMSESKREWRRQGLSVEEILENPSVLNKRKLLRRDYRRFYNTVLYASAVSQDFIRRTMFSDRREWKQRLKIEMDYFNWVPLIPKFSKMNESDLRRAWWSLMKKMAKEFCREIDSNFCGDIETPISDGAQEDAWIAALNIVMPLSPMNLPTLKLFCHALARCTSKTVKILDRRFIDIDRLRKKLCKYGIIHNEDYSFEDCRLFGTIQNRLRAWNLRMFNHLDFPLCVRDKLRIAERCFDHLMELHGETRDDAVREAPIISRVVLVENTIRTILDVSEGEWSPPKALQRYVHSDDLIDAFSGNAGRLRSEESEKRLFRKTVFCDKRGLRVPVFNRTAADVWNSQKSYETRRTEADDAEEERTRPPKGWAEERYSAVERTDDYTEHTEIEEESSDSDDYENESTRANTTLARMSETIIAGHDMTQHSQNQNQNKTLGISPIKRNKHSHPPPDDIEDEEEEELYPGETQEFSHLLVGGSQPPAKRRRASPPAGDASSWLDIFS